MTLASVSDSKSLCWREKTRNKITSEMNVSATHIVQKKNDTKRGFRRERVYDYLYDPVHTVSSEVDHVKANFKACTSKTRLRKVPEFECMFSSMPHHPPYTVHLDSTDPVPAFIDRRWRGHKEQRQQALQQLTEAGIIQSGEPRLKHKEFHVTGSDRWKYFECPLKPCTQQIPQDQTFALPKGDLRHTDRKNVEKHPTHITAGVQTDYRESETQTDPYSPEYVLKHEETKSELLSLATLTWGRGLPAGQAEVEMIERARAKQAWEATLPPLNDLSQLDKRRRMMEEMERKEFVFREEEIQRVQDARLAVLKDLMRQREEAQKKATNERLHQFYLELMKEKETKQKKIQHDYERALRKLQAKRMNVEGKLVRRDIVKDYAKYSSQIHAPMGLPKNVHEEFTSPHFDKNEGLKKLDPKLFKPYVKTHKVSKDVIVPAEYKEIKLIKEYQAVTEELKKKTKKPLRFLVKKEKPVPRPVTPTVEEPPEGSEEKELAIIHLQKLLRGRSVQYKMFKEKEKHLDLIQELRTGHALQRGEQEIQRADKEFQMTLKKERDQISDNATREEAHRAGMVGAELQHLFDTLSKELIHLQEERRIHAFMLLAERTRSRREAEESGRRQVEERRHMEEDEIFRQVVQVHQDTVDLYLEDIILGTIDHTADQQAREEIRRMAREVNDIAYTMEESRNSLQSEEIVSELVHSFLIPEVQKVGIRQRVRQRQRRHLQAAHDIIHGTAECSGLHPGPRGTSQPAPPSERDSSQVTEEQVTQAEQEETQRAGELDSKARD